MRVNLTLVFFFGVFAVFAHNPLTSRVELHANFEKGALLDIYLTQAGVHNALTANYPDVAFGEMELDEYKGYIIRYLKERIQLVADGNLLEVGGGAIKLGTHQTDVKLYVTNYPDHAAQLEVKIDAFKENGHQQTVFWWYTPEETSKAVLSKNNDFRASFGGGLASNIETAGLDRSSFILIMTLLALVLAAMMVLFVRSKMAQAIEGA